MLFKRKPLAVPSADEALPGRDAPIATARTHFVFGRDLIADPPEGYQTAVLGMGCFWGAERLFWNTEGVWLTAVGYAGGHTPNPTYQEVCSGMTGHTEVVKVVFDPEQVSFGRILALFWENHDPTQGMRQGNDVGTQYRSAIYTLADEQDVAARQSAAAYARALANAGVTGEITTEIAPLKAFFHAEPEHQQYLAKNPMGYCGIGGTGVSCPTGVGVTGEV